jgi:hypothetical protein
MLHLLDVFWTSYSTHGVKNFRLVDLLGNSCKSSSTSGTSFPYNPTSNLGSKEDHAKDTPYTATNTAICSTVLLCYYWQEFRGQPGSMISWTQSLNLHTITFG